MDIKKLARLNANMIKDLGNNGYSTNKIYGVERVENAGNVSFNLSLKDIATPFKKNWQVSREDVEDYNEIIDEKNSFGAYENNKLVGILICEDMEDNTFFIEHILIMENHRKKGFGKKLVQKMMEHAALNKIKFIELETENTNAPAIEFFKKLNFKITGVNLKAGTQEAAVIMSCKL